MARGPKRPDGKCRICGVVGPLSWEHVPPAAAYNNYRIVRATQEQMLKPGRWDGARGQVQQRGSGDHTLCEHCNNDTGAWYGTEYATWAKQGLERLARVPAREESPFYIPFRGRPLRFLKQVITMFFSVNNERFADFHPELVKFVRDRHATGIPPQYKVDLVLVRSGFGRKVGISGNVNLAQGSTEVSSEVAHYPFALRLILGEAHGPRRGPIEHFAQLGADEEREVWLYTMAGHVETKFPGDYRSREHVEREATEGMREPE